MSAARLREAATLMRERAKGATPWTADVKVWRYEHGGGRIANDSETGDRTLIADLYGEGNREHFASWHPAVALAVADWLDREADTTVPVLVGRANYEEGELLPGSNTPSYRKYGGFTQELIECNPLALAVANAYLGSES